MLRVFGNTALASATAIVLGAVLLAPANALATTPERDALEAAIDQSKQAYASGVITQTTYKSEGQLGESTKVAGLRTNTDGEGAVGWAETTSTTTKELSRQVYVRSGNTVTGYIALNTIVENVGWSERVKNIVINDVTKRGGSGESLVAVFVETFNDEYSGYRVLEYEANPAMLIEFFLDTTQGAIVTSRTEGATTVYTVQSQGGEAPVSVTVDANGRITGWAATDAASTSEARVLAYGADAVAPDWTQDRIDSPLPRLADEYTEKNAYLKEVLSMAQKDAQVIAERRGGKVVKPMLRKALAQAQMIIPEQFRIVGVPGGFRVTAGISTAAREAFGPVCGKLTVQRGRAVVKHSC